jgi:hypothetical protein
MLKEKQHAPKITNILHQSFIESNLWSISGRFLDKYGYAAQGNSNINIENPNTHQRQRSFCFTNLILATPFAVFTNLSSGHTQNVFLPEATIL